MAHYILKAHAWDSCISKPILRIQVEYDNLMAQLVIKYDNSAILKETQV